MEKLGPTRWPVDGARQITNATAIDEMEMRHGMAIR
jgi:hypothetical protein